MEGRWTVPEDKARSRLDLFLAAELPEHSRSQIQNWIRTGNVLVNGNSTKTGHLLRAGDELVLHSPPEPPFLPEPEAIPLSVLYEDSDIAVIDKPAGLVCHAGAGRRSGTLVNALLHRWGGLNTGDSLRPGIVHRLDRGTSGVIVVARTAAALRSLGRQFKDRTVKKEYLALVHGKVAPRAGTIDAPLGRDPRNRKKISPRARKQRTAVTRYETLESLGAFTLLKVRPETGRTHQIRVHLAARGNPVVGDTLYGGARRLPPQIQSLIKGLDRFCLHASRIEFLHPSTGVGFSVTAELPPELTLIIEALRGAESGAIGMAPGRAPSSP